VSAVGLDQLSPQPTPANRALPHLRSEVSRLTHRRLYRALVVLLLAGIVVISLVAFLRSAAEVTLTPADRQRYEQDLALFARDLPQFQDGWEACVAGAGSADVAEVCGPRPTLADGPRPEFYASAVPYDAAENLPSVVVAVTMASVMLAFLLGASSGGAEWSSRSMTLQLLWEPRRLRLLALKWAALALVSAVTAAVALAVGLALGAVTTSLRGSWGPPEEGLPDSFWADLAGTAGRGIVLVVLAASFAFAIAMLVRNTGAALGTAFVYFAVLENAVRIVLMRFGSEAFMLSTNAAAFVVPGGVEVPRRVVETPDPAGGTFTDTVMMQLGNGRAFLTLLGYLLVLAVPAVWSFTRRDVS
jgi:hypothetical protein